MSTILLRNREIFIFPKYKLNQSDIYNVINCYIDFNNSNNFQTQVQRLLLFTKFIDFILDNYLDIKKATFKAIINKIDIVIKSNTFNLLKIKKKKKLLKSYNFLLEKKSQNKI